MEHTDPWPEDSEDVLANGDRRHFRILGLLGRGGFGNVYRARMERSNGFSKVVALKILRDDNVPLEVLQRFRDEARVLGLVRDRAIVGVESPTRLNGRWALVMECVEGAPCNLLLKRGPLPPTVALGVVVEIARALDKVYLQLGPDGEPLHLLHRDIKPANVHVTPEGDVKILDFGIARARFSSREASTSTHVGGTLGFIAPERLAGREGPEGDVYSLGVMLHVLVTRHKAVDLFHGETGEAPTTPGIQAVLQLSEEMRAAEPAARPTAREVEEHGRLLLRSLEGPSLTQWAASEVPAVVDRPDDGLVGSVLSETLHTARLPRRTSPVVLGGVLGLAGVAIGGAAIVVALVGIVGMVSVLPDTEPLVVDGRGVALPDPVPFVAIDDGRPTDDVSLHVDGRIDGSGTEGRAVEGTAPEDPAPGSPPPLQAIAPRPRAVPRPLADPVAVVGEDAPGPEPVGEPVLPVGERSVPVNFDSTPRGAAVHIDGDFVGTTPLEGLPLPPGPHQVRLVGQDGSDIQRTIQVGGRRGSTQFTWSGSDTLVTH